MRAGNGLILYATRVALDDDTPVPIRSLVQRQELTRDKGRYWSMALRRSQISLSAHDAN